MNTTSKRLSIALLGYVILVILLLTLNPFYIALPRQLGFKQETGLENLVQNTLLFLPLGFLYRLTTGRRGALLWGAAFSIFIEILQLFLPDRTTSVIDILANTFGSGLGAFFYDQISTWIALTPSIAQRLRLETPLIGVTYLLVPLLWVDSFTLQRTPDHWFLLGLIGICGAIIFSDLFRHWRDKIDVQIITYSSLATGLWFLIGAGPGLQYSHVILMVGICLMLLSAFLTSLPLSKKDRRFEQSALKRLVPFFALYLFLLTIWSPFTAFGAWHASFGFTNRLTDTKMQTIYPRLEYLIAFTVLGYLIAEWRGRLEFLIAQDLPHLLLIASAAGLILEILSGFQMGRGASLMRFIFALAGALFGGIIYHTSRDHIRFLLGR